MKYTPRITQITIAPEGEPIFSEMATVIEIEDEAAGEYITIIQPVRDSAKIAFNDDEWKVVKNTVDKMFEHIKENEAKTKK